MGEVLTDAVAVVEYLAQRGRNHGGLGIVAELLVDAPHEVRGSDDDACARWKAAGGIVGHRSEHRHQRAGEDIADRRRRPEAGGLEGGIAHALPGRARRIALRRCARQLDPRARIDAQMAVLGVDDDALGQGAEEVAPCRPLRGPRPDVDAVGDQLLAAATERLQPQRAARKADVALIFIGGDMPDVVDHARPVSFSGRVAFGPCGK